MHITIFPLNIGIEKYRTHFVHNDTTKYINTDYAHLSSMHQLRKYRTSTKDDLSIFTTGITASVVYFRISNTKKKKTPKLYLL